jgi:glycosidase
MKNPITRLTRFLRPASLLVSLLILTGPWVVGQAVITSPAFPSGDQPVTLIFDLKQAKDSRAAGLLGRSDDVYLWSGAGSTDAANAFEFQPAGQTNFNVPFVPGRMTALGNDRWSITITPRTYFGVPADRTIRKLGVLLKNGAGNAQTEDFIVPLYDSKLQIRRSSPLNKSFFVGAGEVLPVSIKTSAKATITLRLDDVVLSTLPDTDTLAYNLSTGNSVAGQRRQVITTARTATETVADTFAFTIRPQPTVVNVPPGLADGINYRSATQATLVLFAPGKQFVYLIGEFNNWQPSAPYLMQRSVDGTRHWLDLNNLTAGQEVAFQYLVDGVLPVADPYTEKILDPNNDRFIPALTYPSLKPYPVGASGIVSVLQTNQPAYAWKSGPYARLPKEKLVIYELLVRDFTENKNYKTLTDSLAYLKRLGVNTIELMPIMEFSGNDSWGYNPIFYFAPDKAYGTKNDLKNFIDQCHANGIGVLLDMVLNQADYEFPYVKLYWNGAQPTADNPYFNPQATHPFSVFFDFNHESPNTKTLVDRVNRHWLSEYRFDGFRFDLSKGFTQRNSGSNVSAWGNYDASRVAIWKRIYDNIRAVDPTAYVMLEHFADNQEETELANYGMLFWGNSNGDGRGAAKGTGGNLESLSWKARGWAGPNLVSYVESHDEERIIVDLQNNGAQSGSYNVRQLATALERAKLLAAFALTVPGPKLIWQFGEFGYDVPIDQNGRTGTKPTRWDYLLSPDRLRLWKVYQALIRLKTTEPAFATTDYRTDLGGAVKRVTLNGTNQTVFLIGNFGTTDLTDTAPIAAFPKTGTWYDYFGGPDLIVSDLQQKLQLRAGEFHLYTTQKLTAPAPNLTAWSAAAPVVLATPPTDAPELVVYPNPAIDRVLVRLTNAWRGPVTLTLTTSAGRTLSVQQVRKSADELTATLPLGDWPAGVYWLRCQAGQSQLSRKIIRP